MLAALYLGAAYTQPSSPLHKPLTEAVDNAASHLWHSFTALPVVNLLDWHGINDCPRKSFPADLQRNGYQHRHTAAHIEVVPATDTPYTPEELSEIYKSY